MHPKKENRIIIDLPPKPFDVWTDLKGKVYQSGRFSLPEVLEDFGDTQVGRFEAGAFIQGMLKAVEILKR